MKYTILYLLAINIICFAMMGIDKSYATHHRRRISEKALFTAAVLGGAAGGTIGMYAFRHKTRHWYFKYGFPLIFILQLILLFFLRNTLLFY